MLDESKPLYVDLGAGKGDFLLDSAKAHPENVYLGIEVRVVQNEEVQQQIEAEKLENCWCVQGNATISMKTMFKDKEVCAFFIQFPDPWLKNRNKKRRMITPVILDGLYDTLKDDGIIYLITDVQEVFDDFVNVLSAKFKQIEYKYIEEQSHWEKWHVKKGTTLYRACFVK